MRISVVTISFNQINYLRRCIDSVLSQNHKNIEYIVVDPGSGDGSRELVESYSGRLKFIFEKDEGPADGLNKGFLNASGDIFCYINSDDEFTPESFACVADYFSNNPDVDVICGNAYVINSASSIIRSIYSDKFSLSSVAYGACVSIQPATFFRRTAFFRAGGFNIKNKTNWDGELLVDMAMSGSKFRVVDKFLGCYRIHSESITGSGRLSEKHASYQRHIFLKIFNREFVGIDVLYKELYRIRRWITNPRDLFQRILHGSVFGSGR